MEGRELRKVRKSSVRRSKVFRDNLIERMSYSVREENEWTDEWNMVLSLQPCYLTKLTQFNLMFYKSTVYTQTLWTRFKNWQMNNILFSLSCILPEKQLIYTLKCVASLTNKNLEFCSGYLQCPYDGLWSFQLFTCYMQQGYLSWYLLKLTTRHELPFIHSVSHGWLLKCCFSFFPVHIFE